MVYWNTQEVIGALIGGSLIAASTTLNLWLYGRITGLSGIFNSVVRHDVKAGFDWKLCFFVGLLTVPVVLNQIFGNVIQSGAFAYQIFDSNEVVDSQQGLGAWIIGGLLVGWGTRMGNGCTSGHGVCGMPRFAPRSIMAVMTFMGTGFAMATFRYHVPFFTGGSTFGQSYANVWRWIALGILIASNILVAVYIALNRSKARELCLNYIFGIVFGTGLVVSGMCRITKIQNFLIIGEVWDPSLIFVMMSAVAINVVTFNYILRKVPKPLLTGENGKYAVPPRGAIDARLVVGAAIFGLGWGLSGLCPGPGIICFFSLTHAIIWVVSLIVGQLAFDFSLDRYLGKSKAA